MRKLKLTLSVLVTVILTLLIFFACTESVVRDDNPTNKSSTSSVSSSSSSSSSSGTWNVYSEAAFIGDPGTTLAGGSFAASLKKYDADGGSALITIISTDNDPADSGGSECIQVDITSDGAHDVVVWIGRDGGVNDLSTYTSVKFAIKEVSRTGYQGKLIMKTDEPADFNRVVPIDTGWLNSSWTGVNVLLQDFIDDGLDITDVLILFGIALPAAESANGDHVTYLIDNVRFE